MAEPEAKLEEVAVVEENKESTSAETQPEQTEEQPKPEETATDSAAALPEPEVPETSGEDVTKDTKDETAQEAVDPVVATESAPAKATDAEATEAEPVPVAADKAEPENKEEEPGKAEEQTEQEVQPVESQEKKEEKKATEKDGDMKAEDNEAVPKENTDGTENKTIDAAQAETTDAAQAETTDAAQAETTDAAQAETTDTAQAETTDTAQAETTDAGPKQMPESAEQTTDAAVAEQTAESAPAETMEPAPEETANAAPAEITEPEAETAPAADIPPPTTPAEDKQSEPEGADKTGAETEEPAENSLVPQEIPSATVKFVLLPSAQVATMKCALNQTLRELKEHFALELKIPAAVILLLHEGANVENEQTLAELGVGPNGTVQLEMQSADPINTPIKAFRPRQEYVMPDVITVRVETEPKRYKDIVVEVERSTRKKPFLGGYRHKETNVEFHHASAQTGQKPRATSNIERYCRDTQTYQMKHIRQQTSEDTSTQMTKIGVYVSNVTDKLLVPGKYTTAEQHHRMILRKVVILQKYWRRWLALRYVTKLKVDRQRRQDWEKQEEIKKREEKELRIKREFERRMNPKSKEDFDLLYAALEKWRLEEMDKIDSTLCGAERKAALCQLLDQETQLIGSIGRHKKDADSENKEKIVLSFLNKAASPKKWRGPDGCFTEMDTPYTIRAQELRDIYNSICMKYLTQDERLDVLLTLKHTVKEHDCKLTQEIIELIDREADLLMRGIRDTNLEGLRKRISTLFLQYIKTPTFNPEAARLLKVPQDPSTLRQNIYYCASCNQYMPSVEFQFSTNSRTVGRCRKCRNLDNDARTRQDYSHYRLMLRALRRVEESYGDDSKVAFLLQENDLRYLVEKIWNSQSIISAWDDLYDLILVRWDKHKEWSPWNCVLVTKEESSAHEKLETLSEGYGKELIHKIHRKHALARNYFSRLPGMSEHMRKRVTEPIDGPAVEVIPVN